MLKQPSRSLDLSSKQIQQQIQFLLSNIRSRQNGLIFFLERFTSQCKNQQQFITYKEQFLQKEKIYTNQVTRIIHNFSQDTQYKSKIQEYCRTFWIKIKSIIKVSMDRLRMLKLLNEKIFDRYQEIINVINQFYDQQRTIQDFQEIQNLLKKRNMDALIYSRNYFHSPNSETKIGKNRSESAFKQIKFSPKLFKELEESFGNEEVTGMVKLKFEEDDEKDPQMRMKSLNRYRRKKILLESKGISTKNTQKNYKKIIKSVQKYQKCLQGAMDCVIQVNIDKKKSIKQNEQSLYDELFSKNIPNHKMISKFLFGTCGIAELLNKRKQIKTKKILIAKIDKHYRESKQIEKKIKSKHIKQQKQKDKQKVDKQKQKDHEKQKQKQRQKQKHKQKSRQKQRPQSSLTAQIRGIFEQQKRKMIQTTLILQDKKNSRYRKKIGTRIQKYTKIIKLIS